ncbi:MAG: glycoside hydrolase family 92 protein, partial [Pyrinomonadaceae bacterium]|nr:glycoside hydrolase family 92 protein [Sphingobacteriaceae bacterium]
HNLKTLVDTLGKSRTDARLDSFFTRLDAGYDDDWYNSGNQTDIQAPWTYNWIGKPYKTQVLVKRIVNEQFSNTPSGLPGNDDAGTMGAWYVFARLGMFPMVPGQAGFSLNGPSFPKITLHLNAGKVVIKGGSETEPYIRSLKINGKVYNSTWLPFSLLERGGSLNYKLQSNPTITWGNN